MLHPHLAWIGWHLMVMAIAPIVAGAVIRACERTGTSRKALAIDLGIPESQLSHALAGVKQTHIPLDRFTSTSPTFRAVLLEELASVWGIADLLVTARDVMAVLRSQLEPAGARRHA